MVFLSRQSVFNLPYQICFLLFPELYQGSRETWLLIIPIFFSPCFVLRVLGCQNLGKLCFCKLKSRIFWKSLLVISKIELSDFFFPRCCALNSIWIMSFFPLFFLSLFQQIILRTNVFYFVLFSSVLFYSILIKFFIFKRLFISLFKYVHILDNSKNIQRPKLIYGQRRMQ